MSITLHHVCQVSPKPQEAVKFYTQDWGLRETGRDDRGVRLAAAEDSSQGYSLVIKPGSARSVEHFCLVSDDEGELDALRRRIADGGVTVTDESTCEGVGQAFHIIDIDGRRVEFGLWRDDAPPAEELRDAVPLKPGHIVLNTPDIEAATDWYQRKLGFGLRDWRAEQMSFLYANTDHHTIAFNRAPHGSLNHVAWELPDINEFFRAVGRAEKTELGEKLYGPGRHGPGDYVFCYFLDPSGFMTEYETDGLKIANPADYEFRVWEYSAVSSDQWLGTLSGGLPERFRVAAKGVPDPGWHAPDTVATV